MDACAVVMEGGVAAQALAKVVAASTAPCFRYLCLSEYTLQS